MATSNENRQYAQVAMALDEPTPRQSRNCYDLQLFSFPFVKNGKDSKSRKRQYVLSVFCVVTLSQFRQIVSMLKPTFIRKFATPVRFNLIMYQINE